MMLGIIDKIEHYWRDHKAAVIVVDDPAYPEDFPFDDQIKLHEGGRFIWKTVTVQH